VPQLDTIIFDGSTFRYGPRLPSGTSMHCQVTVHSTYVFITGGYANTYLFNWEERQWSNMENNPGYSDVMTVHVAC